MYHTPLSFRDSQLGQPDSVLSKLLRGGEKEKAEHSSLCTLCAQARKPANKALEPWRSLLLGLVVWLVPIGFHVTRYCVGLSCDWDSLGSAAIDLVRCR